VKPAGELCAQLALLSPLAEEGGEVNAQRVPPARKKDVGIFSSLNVGDAPTGAKDTQAIELHSGSIVRRQRRRRRFSEELVFFGSSLAEATLRQELTDGPEDV
jgi:hypothetical protein